MCFKEARNETSILECLSTLTNYDSIMWPRAQLWIDGRQLFSGYRGHYQFRQNQGVMFSAVNYGNAKRATFVFRTFRFEVK